MMFMPIANTESLSGIIRAVNCRYSERLVVSLRDRLLLTLYWLYTSPKQRQLKAIKNQPPCQPLIITFSAVVSVLKANKFFPPTFEQKYKSMYQIIKITTLPNIFCKMCQYNHLLFRILHRLTVTLFSCRKSTFGFMVTVLGFKRYNFSVWVF